MTSFNDGIEAAWRLVCSRAQGGTIDLYSVSEAVQALKRPEPSEADVARLVEAMRAITEGAQTTFRARNGRQCSIEADDGEACLIVHSDLIHEGKQALAPFQQEARDAAD